MTDRQITRFVDVVVTKDTPKVSAAGFGFLLVLTDSAFLTPTTRVKSFTSDTDVAEFFSSSSEEYKAANAFLNQNAANDNFPEIIYFGRFVDVASSPILECGDSPETDIAAWQAVTDGEFALDINGTAGLELTALDFSSVTSLDDVATVIDTALGANGDCYYQVNRFVFEGSDSGDTKTISLLTTVGTPAGTDISGSSFLDGDTAKSVSNPGGSILSQGQDAETEAACYTAIENVDDDWYALGSVKKFRDSDSAKAFADETESRRKMFMIATNDANTVVSGSTSTFAYYVKNANYKRTGHFYHDDSDLYPEMAWMGLQLPKNVGQTNWAYKELPGVAAGQDVEISAVSLTKSQIDAALAVNTNVYTTTLGASFVYFGTMGGGKNTDKEGEYIDVIRNVDFLQARIEEGLLSLLLEVDIIPYTDGGISMADNRLRSNLDTYGVKQGILVEGSVTSGFPKRSDTTSTDRDDRILPDGYFNGELQGAINKIIVRGKVYV